jgi:acetolactate synthase small subunit
VYVLQVTERPGIVHAIAAVFAHRGLSMRGLVADAHSRPPRVLVAFRGTQRQCRMVEQVLARLHDVHSVRALEEDSAQLRAFALCHAHAALPDMPDLSIQAQGETSLLSGSYAAVDRALERFVAEGLVSDFACSLVAL